MKWYFYLVFACALGMLHQTDLQANNAPFALPEATVSSKSLESQPCESDIVLSLPLSFFAQEVVLREELMKLLTALASNPKQAQLHQDLREYVGKITALKTLFDTYLFFLSLKTVMHCQRCHLTPSRLPHEFSENDSFSGAENQLNQAMEQQISVVEIMELLQRVEEDLIKISTLERSDKKEIMAILLARKQYLDRKLKELGILRYSSQSSFWNSSLPWVVVGLCLGVTMTALCMAILDHDGTQLTIQLPSKTLFSKNFERFKAQENQPPALPAQPSPMV